MGKDNKSNNFRDRDKEKDSTELEGTETVGKNKTRKNGLGETSDGHEDRSSGASEENSGSQIGLGIAIGTALGVSFGALFDNIALGIAFGIALGVAIGSGMDHQKNKNSSKKKYDDESEDK